MPESSVTAAGRSAPSPDGARSGTTALRRGQKKTSRHSQRRAESGVSERRHGNGTLFDVPGGRRTVALPASLSGRRPPRHSARTRRTRQSASNNRTRFPRLPPDAPGQQADTSLPRTARAFMARKQTLPKASGLPQPDHMVRNACSPPFRRISQPRRLQNPGPCGLRVTRPFPVLPSVSGRLNKKKSHGKP